MGLRGGRPPFRWLGCAALLLVTGHPLATPQSLPVSNPPLDPGRVVSRRMNRSEYRNTIRDLLAVDFLTEKNFPTDDSGYGFDNIGEILTVSPVLMEKYLEAAEAISSRAMGADPLPAKPIEATPETPAFLG